MSLHVGACEFTTTQRTLCAVASRLSALPVPAAVDGGMPFFDRDPKHFGTILNFLRNGGLRTLLLNTDLTELLAECDYYGIADFAAILRERVANNVALDAATKRNAFTMDVSSVSDPAKI